MTTSSLEISCTLPAGRPARRVLLPWLGVTGLSAALAIALAVAATLAVVVCAADPSSVRPMGAGLLLGVVATALAVIRGIVAPLHRLADAASRLVPGGKADFSMLMRRRGTMGEIAAAIAALTVQLADREAKSAEHRAALQEAERSFRDLIDALPTGVMGVDCDGNIDFVNAEIARMFQYDPAELVGAPIEILLPVDIRDCHQEVRRAFCSAPTRHVLGPDRDVSGLRKDGTLLPVEVTIGTVRQNRETAVLCTVADVSERKDFERQLAARAVDLERSNTELAQFAYVASHDLQEPLRLIANYLELLRSRCRGRLDGEAMEFVEFAVDGVVSMKRLISDLLKYARVSNQSMNLETVDTGVLIASAVNGLAMRVEESGADIRWAKMPEVRADGVQLQRVFTQLIDNAVKYRRDVSPRIRVTAGREGEFWRFSVADNGIGVDPSFSNKIFEIFKRLHGQAEYGGTGIGLAVAKMVVERHGGRIWVEPANGGGSVFHFTLPVVPTAENCA